MRCRPGELLLLLGLAHLATVSWAAQDVPGTLLSDNLNSVPNQDVLKAQVQPAHDPSKRGGQHNSGTSGNPPLHGQDPTQVAEASRAYRQALLTLSTLTAYPPSHTRDPSFGSYSAPSTSFLSSFLPSAQGQGPLGSFIRILIKLHQRSWLPRILTIGKQGLGTANSKKKDEEFTGKAIKVIDLLHHSAELGNMDAVYSLAQLSLFPPNAYFPSDPELAYHLLSEHASKTGNASSQALLAFFHATGYRQIVPVDQAKAHLYYTFAALGGDKGAQMALGYRHWAGIGTLDNCDKALDWYESAAQQAMDKFVSGPPGGLTLPQTATRLSDLAGGVYGPGASVASTGVNVIRPAIKAGFARAAGETWEDVLDYYVFNADRDETQFQYRLGKIFYQGSIYSSVGGIASGSEGVGATPRDFQKARHYFLRIARQVWPHDPTNPLQYSPPPPKDEGGLTTHAAASACYLGRMALRGEGVKPDPAVARMWFERGAAYDDRECHNGLGIIWRDGLVQNRVDVKKAITHFAIAAGQELAEAQVNIGKYHYERGELKFAMTFLENAIRQGSPFEAYYYTAAIQAAQARSPNVPDFMTNGFCAVAVSFYKLVAERGVWEDDLLRDAEAAWLSGTDRGKEIAMLKWWIAAERGSEVAQNNMAYILDQDKSILRLTRFSPITPSNDTARLALTQWIRSAAQTNVDSLVKVADYYYHGLGVSDSDESVRLEKAARYYLTAANTQTSALAMWNLGWMYENGKGVTQDFHLAKRYYDMALETNNEAYLPVMLSLAKLYARSIWHTMTGGHGGLKLWNFEREDYVREESKELEGRTAEEAATTESKEDSLLFDDDDGPWYFGKAKEEFQKRRRGQTAALKAHEEADDPIQWARERRNAEHDREGDYGPEGGGHHRAVAAEDEFGETVLLAALCLLVLVLMYLRARMGRGRAEQQQQQQQQQPQQPAAPAGEQNGDEPPPLVPVPEPDGGLFPAPGDPARDEWAILR